MDCPAGNPVRNPANCLACSSVSYSAGYPERNSASRSESCRVRCSASYSAECSANRSGSSSQSSLPSNGAENLPSHSESNPSGSPTNCLRAYRIVVSAKMFLFRASVPSTSLRAGSEAAGVIVPRTKDEVQRTKQAPRAKDKMAGATGLLLLSLPPCPSSQDVSTFGFWSSVAEARSHKPQAAGRELGLRA